MKFGLGLMKHGHRLRFMGIFLLFLPWIAGGQNQRQVQPSSVTGADRNNYFKGLTCQRQWKFDSAILYYQRDREGLLNQTDHSIRLKELEKRMLECASGKKLKDNPRNFIVTNLGQVVNSPFEDYAPVLTADEKLLVFTSCRPAGNLKAQKSFDGKYFEDIFFTNQADGKWVPPQNIGGPINTPFHDSALALSADGKKLFLYTDENQGDVLVSEFADGKWGTPRPLPPPINSPYHESSISISSDGKKIFIASERPGGWGGSDIYVIEKNEAGQWGTAMNLGPSINSQWDEDSPFLSFDGKILYFSSRGHDSMGGFDIFRSLQKSNQWSEAENLGFPINTPGNDIYFVSTKDGKRAYYSSIREEGLGADDIYLITLPKELEEEVKAVSAIQKGLDYSPVQKKQPFLVIYFTFAAYQPSIKELQLIDDFISQIPKEKDSFIQVDGHTDKVGSNKFNLSLSISRAQSVKAHLVARGIPPERITTKGWGAGQPAMSNDDEKEGRELNRRVEIRVNYN